eukprot:COSAG02_NODE_16834_length_1052_cov_1.564533_2_plen_55_part_01
MSELFVTCDREITVNQFASIQNDFLIKSEKAAKCLPSSLLKQNCLLKCDDGERAP